MHLTDMYAFHVRTCVRCRVLPLRKTAFVTLYERTRESPHWPFAYVATDDLNQPVSIRIDMRNGYTRRDVDANGRPNQAPHWHDAGVEPDDY